MLNELKWRPSTALPASLLWETPQSLGHLFNNHSPLAGKAKSPPLVMGKYSKTLEMQCL